MAKINFPYGKEELSIDINDQYLKGVLLSHLNEYVSEDSEVNLVKKALENPIGSKKLSELAVNKNKVVIICSDHTRPVPSKVIIPLMLEEIRKGNPSADVTLLIATGFHRLTTKEELINKFGEKIVNEEKIVIHESEKKEDMVSIGTLPSGGELLINKVAYEADLLVSEGFIEPHFFAGFSGGRKSVLPGVASKITVLANHCSEFIDSKYARTGILENNPIHKDMLWAAKKANLAFICNVVINAKKEVVYAVSGDVDEAHQAGVKFLSKYCMVDGVNADIAISTNGGYPLDQNIYQSVKGMTAAEATVRKGGVIIMLAKANDGHGGDSFYNTFRSGKPLEELYKEFMSRSANETIADQWESQILTRILMHATVIYVSSAPAEMIKEFRMIPATSLDEALAKAREIVGQDASIAAIPDGVSVMIVSKE